MSKKRLNSSHVSQIWAFFKTVSAESCKKPFVIIEFGTADMIIEKVENVENIENVENVENEKKSLRKNTCSSFTVLGDGTCRHLSHL